MSLKVGLGHPCRLIPACRARAAAWMSAQRQALHCAAHFPPCCCQLPTLPSSRHLPSLPQLPRYILDEGKDLRIDGIIPTDAAPRGGFNAEGSEGKLKKGLDYPPVIYVAMQVWGGVGGGGGGGCWVGHCCCGSR